MIKVIILIQLSFILVSGIHAQIIDRAPSRGKNIRAVEGGGVEIKIDTVTKLPHLIKKLNSNWNFKETGKAYWIGYTDDMFSIAAHGDSAINELLKFYETDATNLGKNGVIYTIHLIGINRNITGRTSENFINSAARKALLLLLKDEEYTYSIMKLLRRNPWTSDVSHLFEILKIANHNDAVWAIINSLGRYEIANIPINNDIPIAINKLVVDWSQKDTIFSSTNEFELQIKLALNRFTTQFPGVVNVEKALYDESLSKYYGTELQNPISIEELSESLLIGNGIRTFFSGFSHIGANIQYHSNANALSFCTTKTAQNILNKWWEDLPLESKNKFQ